MMDVFITSLFPAQIIGAFFVRAAEALDTPEAHAAYSQGFRTFHQYRQVLASEEADDLFNNLGDLVSKLARLANAPETTVKVAQFVANVCQQLEEENSTYVREKADVFAPQFEEEDAYTKKEKMAATGAYGLEDTLGYDESFVLGGGKEKEDAPPTITEQGGEALAGVRRGSQVGSDGEQDQLPSWDADRWHELKTSRSSSIAQSTKDKVAGIFQEQLQAELSRVQEVERQRKANNQKHEVLCAISFLVFITWTTFALYGLRTAIVNYIL